MNIFFTSRKAAAIIAALVLFTVFCLGMLFGDVRERIINVTAQRLLPIYKVDTQEKKVAITIDGVWGAEKTPQILDIFSRYNVKITFFFAAPWLEKFPEVAKQIVARGHEIGNHSYTHPHCNSLTPDQLRAELRETSALIEDVTGKWPRFFRPPFGEYNNQVIKICQEEGYQTIQWSIDSLDWREPGVDFIVRRILNNVTPGDIILLHNNGTHTADALAIVVPKLIQMGYKIVPLSELVYKDNYYIESHSGVQKQLIQKDRTGNQNGLNRQDGTNPQNGLNRQNGANQQDGLNRQGGSKRKEGAGS